MLKTGMICFERIDIGFAVNGYTYKIYRDWTCMRLLVRYLQFHHLRRHYQFQHQLPSILHRALSFSALSTQPSSPLLIIISIINTTIITAHYHPQHYQHNHHHRLISFTDPYPQVCIPVQFTASFAGVIHRTMVSVDTNALDNL